jgi:NAD(P)-dependent dehydrogenase (short-subunit alcohol dehydrogenase family)
VRGSIKETGGSNVSDPAIASAARSVTSFDLAGSRAFIAGGYGGIGSAVARALCEAGAAVALAGRDAGKAELLASTLEAEGHAACGLAMDARDVSHVRSAVDEAAARLGGLDILVNCVGFNKEQKIDEVTEEMFDDMFRINLRAAMFLGQAVARHQVSGGRGGTQIHVLSVRAQLGMRGYGYSAYTSNKGGMVMLIKQHAVELAQHGITVNGIAPTVVMTKMASQWRADPKRWDALIARIPLGRIAETSDCAGAAVFFCSPASRFVTGQVLYLDGGITATQ